MSRKHCKPLCEKPEEIGYHYHYICDYTSVEDGHRHIIRGVTDRAPNKPRHKHDYHGKTTCNNGHTHDYHGCTDEAKPIAGGHVHNYSGKTSCDDGHKHHYCGTTDREYPSCY